MDQESVVYIYSGIFFSLRKEDSDICKNMDELGRHRNKEGKWLSGAGCQRAREVRKELVEGYRLSVIR